MRAWFVYRMNTSDPLKFKEAIITNAERIKQPKSNHVNSYEVQYIVNFPNEKKKHIGFQTEYSKERKDAFWHKFHQENFIKLVHTWRKESLFHNEINRIHSDMQELMLQFSNQYEQIWNRIDERNFLNGCNQKAWILFYKIRQTVPSIYSFSSLEDEWKYYTRVWRWSKRNTSFKSFPFLRPGIDVHKGYGFDLHGDEGKTWYAVVKFIY